MSSVAPRGASAVDSAFDEHAFRRKIPYDPETEQEKYALYEALIPVLRARKPSDRPRILVVTDIEQDYDDLLAIIFLSEMHRLGLVELAGFVTNHGDSLRRAKFLRTILHLLGLGHVEVAKGTLGVEDRSKVGWLIGSYYELKNATFSEQKWNREPFRDGIELMHSLAREVDEGKEPLTVLLISSLQDISEYLHTHDHDPEYLRSHFKKFVSQGGYIFESRHIKAAPPAAPVWATTEEIARGEFDLIPNHTMANNGWHLTAARHYTKTLQDLKLPSDAWSREAAKAARLEGNLFADLADNGPIGAHLKWLYLRQEFKFYWDPFNAPFIPRLNKDWYYSTRLVLDPDPKKEPRQSFLKQPPSFQDVLPYTNAIAYDGCAAMGAVGDDVMRALGIMDEHLPDYNVVAYPHRIFGRGEDDLGGIDGVRLRECLRTFIFGALTATRESAERLIPSMSVRHDHVQYKTDLHIFHHQMPYLKESKMYEAELDRKDLSDQVKKELQEKNAALKTERLDGELSEFPKVPAPKDIPYELLYKEAISPQPVQTGAGRS